MKLEKEESKSSCIRKFLSQRRINFFGLHLTNSYVRLQNSRLFIHEIISLDFGSNKITFYDIFCTENFALLKFLKKLCSMVFFKISLNHFVIFFYLFEYLCSLNQTSMSFALNWNFRLDHAFIIESNFLFTQLELSTDWIFLSNPQHT